MSYTEIVPLFKTQPHIDLLSLSIHSSKDPICTLYSGLFNKVSAYLMGFISHNYAGMVT